MAEVSWRAAALRRTCVALAALLLAACTTLRPDVARPPSHALADAADTTLGKAYAQAVKSHPGLSGFQLLASGHAAFAGRAALADTASRTLDIQYFSVGDDLTTNLLLERLAAAAVRGVRVRVLLDDLNPNARGFAQRAVALDPNIQVRLFNPFTSVGTSTLQRLGEFSVDGERLNRRMHNKMWVADNAVAIYGSRNLGDEYFDNAEAANFLDTDLLTVGPIVQQMSSAFDEYWNSDIVWPVEAFGIEAGDGERSEAWEAVQRRARSCDTLAPCHWLAQNGMADALRSGQVALAWAPASLAHDPPVAAKLPVGFGIAHPHVDRPQAGPPGELLIVAAYLIPGDDGLQHLAAMRARGDRVAVLTNSLASTDSVAAHAGYAARRELLLQQGVELYEIRPQTGRRHRTAHRWGRVFPDSLHAKFAVQDRRHVMLGSSNQDPRSRLHNTESWITVDSPELAAELAALFEDGADSHHAFKVELESDETGRRRLAWVMEDDDGEPVRHRSEPQAGFWLQLWRGVLSVLLPEHML